MYACPQCGDDNLGISAHMDLDIDIDRLGDINYESGDVHWDDNDAAWCHDCGWRGTAGEICEEEE